MGTVLKLDFQYQTGGPLLAGEGTVVWVREFDANRANVPPGMGVRFDKLAHDSQLVLDQILIEKAKREGTAAPAIPRATSAGMSAVRRPSAVFQVLDPTTGAVAPAGVPVAAGSSEPTRKHVVSPATTTGSAASSSPSSSGTPIYKPLGTTRNPFSKAGSGDEPATASASASSSIPDESDSLDEEPTQIARDLPSFLMSGAKDDDADGEAPTREYAPPTKLPGLNLGKASAGKIATPGMGVPSEKPATPIALGDLIKRANAGDAPVAPAGAPERRTGIQPLVPQGAAAPVASSSSPPAIPPDEPGDTVKATSPVFRVKDVRIEGTSGPTEIPATPAFSEALEPNLEAVFAAKPKSAENSGPVESSILGVGGAKPVIVETPVTSERAESRAVEPPAPPSAAHARRARLPAPLILGSVLALGAAGFFLVRFFQSQATETLSPVQQPVVRDEATVTAEPAAVALPPPAPSVPAAVVAEAGTSAALAPTETHETAPSAPAPEPTAEKTEPKGAAAPEADPSVAKPAEAEKGAKGTKSVKVDSAKVDAPKVEAAVEKSREVTTPKRKPPRGESSAAIPASAPAEGSTPTPAETEAPAAPSYQLKISSKPAGADVSVDGQLLGKTPYTATIPDVSSPHFVTLAKDGYEAFEQMISGNSPWTKVKTAKGGNSNVHLMKLSPKLKPLPGSGSDKPAGEAGPKADDGPLPPSEPGAPSDGTQ